MMYPAFLDILLPPTHKDELWTSWPAPPALVHSPLPVLAANPGAEGPSPPQAADDTAARSRY